jgi:hypothetical protein
MANESLHSADRCEAGESPKTWTAVVSSANLRNSLKWVKMRFPHCVYFQAEASGIQVAVRYSCRAEKARQTARKEE